MVRVLVEVFGICFDFERKVKKCDFRTTLLQGLLVTKSHNQSSITLGTFLLKPIK